MMEDMYIWSKEYGGVVVLLMCVCRMPSVLIAIDAYVLLMLMLLMLMCVVY